MFKLSQPEKDQVITICDHLKNLKYAKALPNAFTEHGAIMAASVLNTAMNDVYEMTPGDLVIGDIEYRFEPEKDPVKLVFSVTITNVSNRNIKYQSNVNIPQMSGFIDHADIKCMILKPGEICIFRGYGFLKRFDEKEFHIIPANQYFTIIATVSPPYPKTDDKYKITKSINVIREE